MKIPFPVPFHRCDFAFSLQGLSTAIVLCVLLMHGVSSRDAAVPAGTPLRILFSVSLTALMTSIEELEVGIMQNIDTDS